MDLTLLPRALALSVPFPSPDSALNNATATSGAAGEPPHSARTQLAGASRHRCEGRCRCYSQTCVPGLPLRGALFWSLPDCRHHLTFTSLSSKMLTYKTNVWVCYPKRQGLRLHAGVSPAAGWEGGSTWGGPDLWSVSWVPSVSGLCSAYLLPGLRGQMLTLTVSSPESAIEVNRLMEASGPCYRNNRGWCETRVHARAHAHTHTHAHSVESSQALPLF